jgi:ABC-type uncharacterized transport system ATPase subunit
MKIDKVEIRNLRAFESVEVPFDDYVCLVGPNGAGKSTILCALNIFFRQTEHTGTNLQNLDKEDFFKGDTAKPIIIRVTFGDLEKEAVEAFDHYVRGGKLIVTAEAAFDDAAGKAAVTHYGERMAMKQFAPFFEKLRAGAPAAELATMYDEYRQICPELPKASSKDARAAALREYELGRPDECESLRSQDEFYGVSKGANRLERFVQWVYVPAVKDALEEQAEAKNSALGKLLARAVGAKTQFQSELEALKTDTRQRYQELLDQNQTALDDISTALNVRLAEWAHHGATLRLEWQEDKDRSVRIEEPWAHVKVGEGAFEGQLARLGHGLQRSYIIALLQELAMYGTEGEPRLLLAIEEPELYQHPPQARHLASVLSQLASKNTQVMVSTHSPYFVSGSVFENVRVVRRPARDVSSTVKWASAADVGLKIGDALGEQFVPPSATIAKLQQLLQPQLAELFFATKVVFVEGREDVAFIQTYLQLKGLWDEFRKHGCHPVAVEGKSELLRPLVVTQQTGIPSFVIFDADGNVEKAEWRAKHMRDNKSLLRALGGPFEQPFPEAVLMADTYVVWPTCLRDEIKAAVPEVTWTACQNAADVDFDQAGKLNKNVMHIARLLEKLWDEGIKPAPLEQLTQRLLAFAQA